jgi:hypothetical protein
MQEAFQERPQYKALTNDNKEMDEHGPVSAESWSTASVHEKAV